ncbi:transporter substrate-binding domain-containing protein [Cryobacterium sp. TMT1-21]|uniref:Transporter substrate-binding domain-containing protein n=1 Tax=Cryobacterium shii TaxID=1259235 RepID=A0AAQ2HFS1_9MICO|nr:MULTISPECIES: transporter substrate-binding domain-containing protein [Cryobacterium]TFC48781.1 transporter substrate-binding domain-containing protein [Cryobacterium shii]TFC81759.1 transporter substrate-binding domain-containing protein [Cryobacterium sp. TmT2-59]TFD17578.1 transporter substrate-binding domain-containing protein [Cryobacterium sp. TMT4-10]TFD18258.1 transporter substrate-binding domain-containing protein [Cryobacterium sp. TMT1-21]TFD24848.1 transporter substrate-binding 
MNIRTTSIAALMAVVLVGSVAACSSAAAPTEDKAQDTLKVGIEGAYPPFNYYDKDNKLVGFDVDITTALSKDMGVKVEYVATPWDSILGGLLAKKYDIIISSMAITEERKAKVDFTEPYYHTGSQLFAPTDTSITDSAQIKGKQIGVAIGTTFEEKARALGADVVTYKSDLLAFEDVKNGRLDGLLTDGPVGGNAIQVGGYDMKAVGTPLIDAAAGIAVNKNNSGLLKKLNAAITKIQDDGTYLKISTKWFGTDIR